MKQTAVEWLIEQLEWDDSKIARVIGLKKYNQVVSQAKEMEKQQIIESGNSCAFKQRLHSDRINKMSIDELEQYNLEPSYTFGEEHYYKTFNK